MSVKKCENGHYFDGDKYELCPHCGKKTEAMPEASGISVESKPEGIAWKGGKPASGEEKTVGIFMKSKGSDPVVGWLVCVDGNERGRDYRLYSGRNFVGRSSKMQVCLYDDPEVTRENHCSVIYEPKKGDFLLAPGSGTSTYINGQRIDTAQKLKDGDKIGIGSSTLDFVPYCGEGRKWD